jgi:hypothetical protein
VERVPAAVDAVLGCEGRNDRAVASHRRFAFTRGACPELDGSA